MKQTTERELEKITIKQIVAKICVYSCQSILLERNLFSNQHLFLWIFKFIIEPSTQHLIKRGTDPRGVRNKHAPFFFTEIMKEYVKIVRFNQVYVFFFFFWLLLLFFLYDLELELSF